MELKTKSPQDKWVDEITAAERELKKFHERAQKVTKRYIDERTAMEADHKNFNIFPANVGILESALYSQMPKPSVTRRFKDYEDEVARVAGNILQRSITQDLDDPRDTFDTTLRNCVQDRLVVGLAQAWVRLETDTEAVDEVEGVGDTPEPQPEMELPAPMQRITGQRVCVDYVFWKDFLWSPCRVWSERRWVARRVYMDRSSLIERFGEEVGKTVSLDYKPIAVSDQGSGSTPQDDTIEKAIVYEIWCRENRKVYWVSKGAGDILDVKDDPLGLEGFEPCPTPMLANLSTSNTTPRPDFYMIQDQYNELDTLNNRISKLVRACKVVGVYDKSATGVARMLKEGTDNDLIPVDNWAMFSEKGGIKGQIDWLPLEQVVNAIGLLNQAREVIKAQIYELTGISDIVRGASKASETLGAQELKAKFASVRIKKLQDEVARFAAQILRIKAEIQAKHFEPEILLRSSNTRPDDQFVPEALALIKDPGAFEWRITVTSDSIAQADYDLEKQDRLGFLSAVSSYLEKAGGMFQAVPESAPLLVGMLKWAVAGFRNASEIEGMLDKELDALSKSPPQSKPDPEAQKMQAEQQKAQQDQQMEQQRLQMEMAVEQQRLQMEQQRQQMETMFEERRLQLEAENAQRNADMEAQLMQMKLQFEEQMGAIKLQNAVQQAAQKAEQAEKEPKEPGNGD